MKAEGALSSMKEFIKGHDQLLGKVHISETRIFFVYFGFLCVMFTFQKNVFAKVSFFIFILRTCDNAAEQEAHLYVYMNA